MMRPLRILKSLFFPSEKDILRWGRLLFPPGKEDERLNLLLWAFPVLLLGLIAVAVI